MNALILEKLNEIEQKENCRIIFAAESGSRAWGFASPDSDYDVRFIYIRQKDAYLSLKPPRDVIELPINSVLDINGWDLGKALKLLQKSNPTMFEWFYSPIVYKSSCLAEEIKFIMPEYFSVKKSLYHYLSMAVGNYRGYLFGDMVRAKKYFYVLRPLLACRWILEKRTPPPMLFSALMESQIEESLKDTVNKLMDLKINSPEKKLINRIDALNEYLDRSIEDIKEQIKLIPDENTCELTRLDALFKSALLG